MSECAGGAQEEEEIWDCPSFFSPVSKPTIFEYKFLRHIGHGAQSDVFLVVNTETDEYFAAKVFDRDALFKSSIGTHEIPLQNVLREAEIMALIDHPCCMSLVEILEDDMTNSILFIMPYADLGPLSRFAHRAEPIAEEEAKRVFFQVARGLQNCHRWNVIHRDLKPDNILRFADGRVVLADFSVSMVLEDEGELLEDTRGTPAFYSPEECMGEPYLGKPTDVWAFGMTLYVMIYGKFPYFDFENESMFYFKFFEYSQMIISDEIGYPESVEISPELRDFFSHVLEKDPGKRYTMKQVLMHKWFDGYNRDVASELEAIGKQVESVQKN